MSCTIADLVFRTLSHCLRWCTWCETTYPILDQSAGSWQSRAQEIISPCERYADERHLLRFNVLRLLTQRCPSHTRASAHFQLLLKYPILSFLSGIHSCHDFLKWFGKIKTLSPMIWSITINAMVKISISYCFVSFLLISVEHQPFFLEHEWKIHPQGIYSIATLRERIHLVTNVPWWFGRSIFPSATIFVFNTEILRS
jgi:hypothetical protein